MKKACRTCGAEKIASRSKSSQFSWRTERNAYYSTCKACVALASNSRAKKRNKAGAAQVREKESKECDPYGFLAADIIIRAIHDWRKFGHMTEKISMGHNERVPTDLVDATSAARREGYGTIRDELLAFFASERFEELCGMANSEPDFIRKHVLANTGG